MQACLQPWHNEAAPDVGSKGDMAMGGRWKANDIRLEIGGVVVIDHARGVIELDEVVPRGVAVVVDYPYIPQKRRERLGRKGKRRGGKWWIR